MAEHVFLKPEKIAAQGLGLLQREILLPNFVWRNPGGDFRGAKGDTITLRVPAKTSAKEREFRAERVEGESLIQYSRLSEFGVDVKLDTVVYNALPITDEQMTLDIDSFGTKILNPQVRSLVEDIENRISAEMQNAPYRYTESVSTDKPANAFILARKALNDENVPQAGRVAVVGSGIEAALLMSDQLQRVDHSGSDSALRDAYVGRVAGLHVYVSNALPEDFGVVLHNTAFALNMVAPAPATSAGFSASQSAHGLGLRWTRDYDFARVQDRSLVDTYLGISSVIDPDVDPDDPEQTRNTELLRAVALQLGS